jgi:DNA-binding NarL/FixJ family response regulator
MRRRVAIVADDPSVRAELARVARSGGHRVEEVRGRGSAATAQLASCDAAIIGDAGDRLLAAVRRAAPELPVIAVPVVLDQRAVSALLRQGVAGIVALDTLGETLASTVDAVCCGQLCVPRAYAAQAERPQLSIREKQILGMVVLGFANIEIAQRLVIAESTVKSHLNSAFRKLGVRTRVEAAALILNPVNGLGTGILTIPTEASD